MCAWSLTNSKGAALLAGSGLGNGTVQLDSGKVLRWTLEGDTLDWLIEDGGTAIFTGSAQLGLESGQLADLTEDGGEAPKDGRYAGSLVVKDGQVTRWSWSGAPEGTGLSAAVQINPKPVEAAASDDGSTLTVSLTGSAKLRISN